MFWLLTLRIAFVGPKGPVAAQLLGPGPLFHVFNVAAVAVAHVTAGGPARPVPSGLKLIILVLLTVLTCNVNIYL